MFISLSKTIARFGGFRLGIGMRLNKKNAMWAWLILFFVGIFQLMWGMMLICGWLMYAMFYGMFWCIKKLIKALSKKQIAQPIQNQQSARKEDIPIMTPEMNNSPNEKPQNQQPKNKSTIVRWVVGGFFAMFALVNGLHFSSLFLLCAAFLMFPLPFMDSFYQTKNIKPIVAIILSISLFLAGVLTSPPSETTNDPSNDTNQTQTNNDNKQENTNKDETPSQPTYAKDTVVNRFITEFNDIPGYDFSDIRQGNIKTKYFAYANDCYVEIINANDAYAERFSVTINGGKETTDRDRMFTVFKQVIKTLDKNISDAQINSAIEYLEAQQYMISDYKISDSVTVETYVPILEVSFNKACRIDIICSNYK